MSDFKIYLNASAGRWNHCGLIGQINLPRILSCVLLHLMRLMYQKRTADIQLLILHLIIRCALWSEKYGNFVCEATNFVSTNCWLYCQCDITNLSHVVVGLECADSTSGCDVLDIKSFSTCFGLFWKHSWHFLTHFLHYMVFFAYSSLCRKEKHLCKK